MLDVVNDMFMKKENLLRRTENVFRRFFNQELLDKVQVSPNLI